MFWVIGKHGQLATAIYNECRKQNLGAITTDRHEVDITSKSDISNFLDSYPITHIFNASGYTDVDRAEEEMEKAYELNDEALEILANCALSSSAKIIHFSTDYVFDGELKKHYSESDKPNPLNVYGKSKYFGEQRLLEIMPEALIIRVSWLFGERGNNFIKTMFNLMRRNESLKIVSDQIGRPTYTKDVAAVVLQMLDFSGIYHFSNKEVVSWFDFAKDIFQELKALGVDLKCLDISEIKSSEYPQKALRPSYSPLQVEKIEKALSFSVPSYKKGLTATLKSLIEESLCVG